MQFDAVEAVIQFGRNNARQNTDELVIDLAECSGNQLGIDTLNLRNGSGRAQRGQYIEADQASQCGSAIAVFRHPVLRRRQTG